MYFSTDKDECLTNEHNCSLTATCVNTIGSFTCSCSPDEIQDGDTCFGIKLLSLKEKFTPEWPFIFFTPIKSFYKNMLFTKISAPNEPVCAAPCFSNRASRDTKKPFTFLSFQTGILTNKSHFKETRSLKYLNFPAKLQAELFDVTHTSLAPRWRRSVVEFWATLEKDFVGI